MLTEKQIEQAERMIMGLSNDDVNKYRALKRHKNALEMWSRYLIPYRIAIDYLKRDLSGVVRINPCYPLPGYPKDKIKPILVHVPKDTMPDELTPNIEKQNEINEYERTLWEYRRILKNECNNDDIGKPDLNEWCYKYGHLLEGYNIKSFSPFDFHGGSDKWYEGDIELMHKVFERLQKQYQSEPSKYITNEPEYKPEYDEQYTTSLFEFVFESKADKERKELLKRIGIGGE